MLKLSAVIITYNEEKYIKTCLDSIQSIVDEIIVLDGMSTDKTPEICQSYPHVLFTQSEWTDFATQRNKALRQASGEMILSIDADESISPELAQEISDWKKSSDTSSAYFLNRKNYCCGRWIRYSGWSPDYQLRIFPRHNSLWKGVVHEKIQLESDVTFKKMKGALHHRSIESLDDYIKKINFYSTLGAQKLIQKGKKPTYIESLIKAALTFFKAYIFRLGFLDRKQGFYIAIFSALANFLKYQKAIEIISTSLPLSTPQDLPGASPSAKQRE